MRFVKNKEYEKKDETKYFVPEIAQALGVSEGTIHGYFRNKVPGRKQKSTKDGLTLDEIVMVIERPRTRGDGIDFTTVKEIQDRLCNEKGYIIDRSDEAVQTEIAV